MLLVALLAVAMSAHAQWFDFSNNNNRFGLGLHMGQLGMNTDYSDFGGGVSVNAFGVYVDFAKAGPEHRYDNHVNNTMYEDSVAYTISLGYQIPVLPWLRLMPVVGYCQNNSGLTDASTVNVDVDENTATVYHDYYVSGGSRQHHFNFGLGLSVTPVKWVDIYAIGSRHGIYGGISINLGAFATPEE